MVATLVHSQSSPVFSRGHIAIPDGLSRSFTAGDVGAHEYDGTQPIETQAFKGYSDVFTSNLGISRSNSNTTQQEQPNTQAGGAVRTGVEADFEITDDIQEDDETVSLSGDGDTPGSPDTQFLRPLIPSQVVRYPETPQVAGTKRKRPRGDAGKFHPTSDLPTPNTTRTDLAHMFGVAQPTEGLSLTQLFENTQAPSSPPGLRSDPVFQRPSPGLAARQSSPLPEALSSPAKQVRLGLEITPALPKSTQMFATQQRTGPLGSYKSMKESQERRAKELEYQHKNTQTTDKSSGSNNTQMEQYLARQRREQQIAEELRRGADLTAPPRSSPESRNRATREPTSTIDLVTPQTVKPKLSRTRRRGVREELDMAVDQDVVSDIDEDFVTSAVQIPMTSSKPTNGTQPPKESSPCVRHGLERREDNQQIQHSSLAEGDPSIASGTQKTEAIMDSQMEAVIESLLPPMADLPSLALNSRLPTTPGLKKFRDLVGAGLRPNAMSSSIPAPPISPFSSQKEAITSSPPAEAAEEAAEADVQNGKITSNEVNNASAPVSPPESRGQKSPGSDARRSGQYPGAHSIFTIERASQGPQRNSSVVEQASKNATTYVTAPTHHSDATENSDRADRLFCTQQTRHPARLQAGSSGDDLALSQPAFDMDIDSIDVLDEGEKTFYRLMAHSPLKSKTGYSSGSSPVQPAKRRKPDALPAPMMGSRQAIANTTQGSKPHTRVQETEGVYDVPMSTDPLNKSFAHAGAAPQEKDQTEAGRQRKAQGKLTKPRGQKQKLRSKSLAGNRKLDAFEPDNSILTVEKLHEALSVEAPTHTSEVAVDLSGPAAESAVSPPEATTVLYPTRILARWRGQSKQAYYPATCLGPSRAALGVYNVRFDEGTVTQLHVDQISSLQLCKGDVVKVDLDSMRSNSYVVEGLGNIVDSQELATLQDDKNVLVDVYGHQTVTLRIKQAAAKQHLTDGDVIHVQLGSIYVPLLLRSKLGRNDQLFLQPDSLAQSRLLTPVTLQSEATTPTNRARRQMLVDTSFQQTVASPKKPAVQGLFARMAFAITLASELEQQKTDCIKMLQENGATLIQLGFEELFDLLDEADGGQTDATQQTGLQLKSAASQMTFVALLADRHSRRAKHMQALALNLPVLHYRWLLDSVEAGQALQVDMYTLPAGESSFLDGAVRSRMMPFTDPTSPAAGLNNMLQGRNQLISGKNVILVTGKGKVGASRRTFEFLDYAMGARRVACVASIDEAKDLVGREDWDWIHVDGNEKQAVRTFIGNTKAESVVRKRGGHGTALSNGVGKSNSLPRVVGDEYVIQSLILGSLLK